jgi:HSP20 family protein
MRLPSLWSNPLMMADPFRREMEDMIRAFGRDQPTLSIGAKAPAINIAETANAIEVTAELPRVEEKDIKVGVEGNRLTISGEKREESKKDEKDWHVEERSYGSFYRSMSLPFTPADGAVEAHQDKGVLHVTVKKPAEAASASKTIEIKTGEPPKQP